MEFVWLPSFDRMVFAGLRALVTGIKFAATFKFNCNNIQWGMVMFTTGLIIDG